MLLRTLLLYTIFVVFFHNDTQGISRNTLTIECSVCSDKQFNPDATACIYLQDINSCKKNTRDSPPRITCNETSIDSDRSIKGVQCIQAGVNSKQFNILLTSNASVVHSAQFDILPEFSELSQQPAVINSSNVKELDILTIPEETNEIFIVNNDFSSKSTKNDALRITEEMFLQWLSLEKLTIQGFNLTNLTLLPVLTQLTDLDLSYSFARKFPLMGTPALQRLYLSGIKFELIDLSKLPSTLQTLEINDCGLSSIPKGIKDLEGLEVLEASNNDFSTLDLFPSLPSLSYLDLAYNKLEELPSAISDMPSLAILRISGNPLGTIPDFVLPQTLVGLFVDNCSLSRIPSFLRKEVRQLQVVDLSYNNISAASFDDIKFIASRVVLNGLGFNSIPKSAAQWEISSYLSIANNLIAQFQASDLPRNIKILSLENNKLESLPNDMERLDVLESLDLSNNPLEKISPDIRFPSNITRLGLSNCQLSEFPSAIEDLADALTHLDLSNNSLAALNISSTMVLNTLKLDGNSFKEFPVSLSDDLFPSLTSLSMLHQTSSFGELEKRVTFSPSQRTFIQNLKNFAVDIEILETRCLKPLIIDVRENSYTVCDPNDTYNLEQSPLSSATQTSLLLLYIALGSLVVFLAVYIYIGRKKLDSTSNFSTLSQNLLQNMNSNSNERMGDSVSAVWHDPILLKWRAPLSEIKPLEVSDLAVTSTGTRVWLAHFREDLVVVKSLIPKKTTDATIRRLVDKIQFLSRLNHSRIVKLLAVAWSLESDIRMVLEYQSLGNLSNVLNHTKHGPQGWSWGPKKFSIALDIANALTYLHRRNILHRALKAKQILLNENFIAKFSDFGVSRYEVQVLLESHHKSNLLGLDADGSADNLNAARWVAPEVLLCQSDYNKASDIYAFGMVLVEMDTHNVPYANNELGDLDDEPQDTRFSMERFVSDQLLHLICTRKLQPVLCERSISRRPVWLQQLIYQCLHSDARQRPTAETIFKKLQRVQTSRESEFDEDNSLDMHQLQTVDEENSSSYNSSEGSTNPYN